MNVNKQKATAFILMLLAATLLTAALSQSISIVMAQTGDEAIVNILPSVGGTTDPLPGDNYTYANGTEIVLTAVPEDGWKFEYWIVLGDYTPGHADYPIPNENPDYGTYPILPSPIDSTIFFSNPATITCGYGYTYNYQAVFSPVSGTPTTTPPPQTEPPTNTSQVVTILPSIGGTTDPAPGTYVYENNTQFTLTATPNEGFTYHYWLVRGTYTPGHIAQPQFIPDVTADYPQLPSSIYTPTSEDSLVFSINPVTVTCGYGYAYTYQAVFDAINATTTPPPIPTSTPELFPSTPPTLPPSTATAMPTSTPVVTQTPSPEVTPTPSESGGGLSLTVIAAIVIVVIVVIIAVVIIAMRRR